MKEMRTGTWKKIIRTGMLLCMLVLLHCVTYAEEPALTRKKVKLQVYNVFVLRLKNPTGEVKWKSTNRKVLSVVYKDRTHIVVRAVKTGKAKVKCSVDGKTLVCTFKVKAIKGIPKQMTVLEGDVIKFRQSSKPGRWKSSDEKIALITGKPKIRSKKIRFRDVGKVIITEKIGKKTYSCKVTVLTKDGYKTREAAAQAAAAGNGGDSTRVWKFILNLFEISQTVDADIAAGVPWAYYNSSSHRSATTFEATRQEGKPWTNCMGGVSFGLRLHDLVGPEGVRWYGTRGGVHWFGAQAELDCRRYFDIIPVFKTVQAGITDNSIHPGDILTYKSMEHVNVYLGNGFSFDTGHAFCSGSGEGARYERWMGPTPYLGYTVCYVLRLKETVDPPAVAQ